MTKIKIEQEQKKKSDIIININDCTTIIREKLEFSGRGWFWYLT